MLPGLEAFYASPIEDAIREVAGAGSRAVFALGTCLVRFDEAAPHFRASLERAARGECETEGEADLLFAGLHILGGGRDPRSWGPLLQLLRRPEDELDWMLGDAISESLSRIMAGVFDGDTDSLFDACADSRVEVHARFDLLRTAAFLTWDGRIERKAMVGFLERFDDERLGGEETMAWLGWAEAAALLCLRSMATRVERAMHDGRIDRSFLRQDDWLEILATAEKAPDDEQRFRDEGLGYIEDALDQLQQAEAVAGSCDWDDIPALDDEMPALEYDDLLPPSPVTPAVNELRHVGRNDPCPCGSGKKFKRCCLGKQ
ncbi:MAG: DUF1186 domain-containing protein [Alphaproteobacteria bacterium]